MAVTIYDVAKAAGVGISTVSRVLNDSSRVSPQTRCRVLDAIEALGYQPNLMARNLSRSRIQTVGVLLSYLTNPFQVAVLQGIERTLSQGGYDLVIFNVDSHDVDSDQRRQSLLESISQGRRCDGLITISFAPSDEHLARLRRYRIPVVITDYCKEGIPSVFVDNVKGGRTATAHLISLGHRRIGYIQDYFKRPNGPNGNWPGADRQRGYIQALKAAGMEVDPGLIQAGHGHVRANGAQAMQRLMEQDHPPTAVFAVSDMLALGAMEYAQANGIRIPDDVAIVGFDDIDLASFAHLTTIRQPMQKLGSQAAAMLLQALAKGDHSSQTHELSQSLVVRYSCGATRPSSRTTTCFGPIISLTN